MEDSKETVHNGRQQGDGTQWKAVRRQCTIEGSADYYLFKLI